MASEPVLSWDMVGMFSTETTFGTPIALAAAQAQEVISFTTGPAELGDIRPKRDRNQGRGMQNGWVEGRVKPIAWSVEKSVLSRAAATTVPHESVFYKAAGLTETVGGASVAYTLPAAPVQSSLSGYRVFGKGLTAYQGEQIRGGLVKTLSWSGGDKELTLKAAGEAIGKYHLGYAASITFASDSDTNVTFASAEESYRFGLGTYLIESEAITITSCNYGSGVHVCTRGALSTSAVAHAGKPLRPYLPTLSYGSDLPLSEALATTVTIDSQAIRCLSFGVDLTTGLDMLPGETGSKYVQGFVAKRYDAKLTLRVAMKREDVSLQGKATQKKAVAATIATGSAAGGIVTFSAPYCEIDAFQTPDTANDEMICDIVLRTRDSAGNDALSVTLT